MTARIQPRTWAWLVVGLAASALSLVIVRATADASALTASLAANLPSIVITGTAGVLCLVAALRFSRTEPQRLQLGALAGAAFLDVAGNLVWMYYEVALKQEAPFPGLPDLFYLAEYLFFGYASFLAIRAFRSFTAGSKTWLVPNVIVGATLLALYFALFRTIFADTETSGLAKALSVAYVLLDLYVLILPMLALVLVLRKFGAGILARPYWVFACAFIIYGAADTLFALMDWSGTYQTGNIVDAGYWVAFTLLAFGAGFMADINKGPITATKSV